MIRFHLLAFMIGRAAGKDISHGRSHTVTVSHGGRGCSTGTSVYHTPDGRTRLRSQEYRSEVNVYDIVQCCRREHVRIVCIPPFQPASSGARTILAVLHVETSESESRDNYIPGKPLNWCWGT